MHQSVENRSRSTRFCTHNLKEDLIFFRISDFLMFLLDRRSHGICTCKSICVKKVCKTRTLAYGTTACYRIGCIIVLLLFTASTFLIVSHAQEQISSLMFRHYGHFKPFRSGRYFQNIQGVAHSCLFIF